MGWILVDCGVEGRGARRPLGRIGVFKMRVGRQQGWAGEPLCRGPGELGHWCYRSLHKFCCSRDIRPDKRIRSVKLTKTPDSLYLSQIISFQPGYSNFLIDITGSVE